DIVTGFDMAGMGWTFLATDGARGRVGRGLHDIVDRAPWGVAAVELHDEFVDALEAVGVKAGAVLLLPDDLLGAFPAGVVERGGCRHEAAQRAEHPHRAGLSQRGPGERQPALDAAIPGERRVAIGRIGEDHVERAMRRHEDTAVAGDDGLREERHGASLPTSAAKAAISRAATLSCSASNTRRPDCARSAKATRWPMVADSKDGSCSASVSAVSRAMTVRAPQRLSTKRAPSCGR